MTDKTVSVPQQGNCTHPQTTYMLGNTYCAVCKDWLHAGFHKPASEPISVPTESRLQKAHDAFLKWANGNSGHIYSWPAFVAGWDAAYSSLLPVPTIRELAIWILSNCAAKYVNPAGYSQSPQDVINFQIHMVEVKIAEFVASLPVGESTREK